jgi:hypothetical protein
MPDITGIGIAGRVIFCFMTARCHPASVCLTLDGATAPGSFQTGLKGACESLKPE